MTHVLILKKIAGYEAGRVVELTDRLQKHVDAGNAKVVPNLPGEVEPEDDGIVTHDGYTQASPKLTGSGLSAIYGDDQDDDTSDEA